MQGSCLSGSFANPAADKPRLRATGKALTVQFKQKEEFFMRFKAIWFVFICNLIIIQVSQLMGEVLTHHGTEVDITITEICFQCHNDNSDNISNSLENGCSIGDSHPVFLDYPPNDKETFFSPRSDVEAAGLVFPNGKITCISCHNLENQETKHLAIENSGSRLCLTCHIM